MRLLPLLVLAAPLLGGCLPYAVGSTARTVPVGDGPRSTTTLQFVPIASDYQDTREPGSDEETFATSYPQIDTEIRFGLDDRSDVGARLVGGSGAVVSYKRRVLGDDPLGPGLALLGGVGVINVGNHAHFEATMIASGSEYGPVTPYGGLRAMQVIPLNDTAVSDRPSLGAFAGLKFGAHDVAIIPEVGVFHDPSALEIRDSNWIVIPSLTVRGVNLFGRFF